MRRREKEDLRRANLHIATSPGVFHSKIAATGPSSPSVARACPAPRTPSPAHACPAPRPRAGHLRSARPPPSGPRAAARRAHAAEGCGHGGVDSGATAAARGRDS